MKKFELKGDEKVNSDSSLFCILEGMKMTFLVTTNYNFLTKKLNKKEGFRGFPNKR